MEYTKQELGRGKIRIRLTHGGVEICRIDLQKQKKDLLLIERLDFGKDAKEKLRDDAMRLFCQKARQEGISLLLVCRVSQSWFGLHPDQKDLIASKAKTKPGF